MRRSFATVLLALSLSTCGTTMPVLAGKAPLLERMADLNAWIRVHTDYTARHLPKVVVRTEEEMARIQSCENPH